MLTRKAPVWIVSLMASLSVVSSALAGYPELPLNLGSAANFAVVAKSGITNAGGALTQITGDISNSPGTAAQMNTLFCTNMYGGALIWGVDDAFTGTDPCEQGLAGKATADLATFDMETAYVNAAGRVTPDGTELGFDPGNGSRELAGMNFAPGLWKWSTNVTIGVTQPGNLTLTGNATDVWIFQIAGDLATEAKGSVATGTKIILAGGAKAENIFWQVGGGTGVTIETYSTFEGTVLAIAQVVVKTGAVLNGRALAQTQVTLDANPVTYPPALVVYAPVLEGHLTGSTTVSGQPFLLTMTVTNTGNIEAINVAARAWNSIGQQLDGPTASSSSYQTLYVGQNVTFTWTATQSGQGDFIFSSTAMEESGALATSSTSSSTIYLTYAPVLSARLDGVTPTSIGQPITFNLTVTNTGGATAVNVAALAWNPSGVALSPTTASSTSWMALYPGQSVRFTWTTTSAVNGTQVFSATAAEESWMLAVSPLATATVVVQTAPVLAAQLISWSATFAGGPFMVTLTVTNNGQATTSVAVTTTAFLIGGVAYTATAYDGPTPAMPFTLTAGGSQVFTWTVTGVNLGAGLEISNTLYGTDVNTGLAVSPVLLNNGFVAATPPAVVTSGPPGSAGKDGSYIYPSPSRGDTARIVYTMEEAGTVKVRIYNAGGNLVVVLDEPKPAGLQTTTVTVSRLSPGVYFYLLEREYASSSGQKIGPRKFVVTR